MPLSLFNTINKKLELFSPITPPFVGMYVCGPTVSGESHLGHARPLVTFDIINRYLRYLGYKVRYVRNITDAGHFEEEGRDEEDKISKKAFLENLEPMELVMKYTRLYHWAEKQLNCLPPDIEPTATGHIVEQIVMIEKIIEKGFAYEMNGSVYFDVKKYDEKYHYGVLSGRKIEDLEETTRLLSSQEEKRDARDFALWKKAPPKHIMRWQSPWGEGYPGWHIECSAMSNKYLGKHFDIHGGGLDLLFPHHESEIAQSHVCNNQTLAKYWLHNNMITINGTKMGKSYNNHITLTELFSGGHTLLEKAYHPMNIRFFILQTHYRSTLDFSNSALQAAEKGMQRLFEVAKFIEAYVPDNSHPEKSEQYLDEQTDILIKNVEESMDDDFNTAKTLAHLFDFMPSINNLKDGNIEKEKISKQSIAKIQKTYSSYLIDILGLDYRLYFQRKDKTEDLMNILLHIRKEAKNKKDFATSDAIRKDLENIGIEIKDNKDNTVSWKIHSS